MKQGLQFRIEIRYVFHFVIRFKLLADFCDNHKKYVVNLHAIYSGFNAFLVLCTICEKSARGYFFFCDVLFVMAVISTSAIYVFLGIEMADAGTHRIKTENLCRFCGKSASSKRTSARPKEKIKLEFERHVQAIEEDNDFIHPPNVCLTCVGYFYRLRRSIGKCIKSCLYFRVQESISTHSRS